jgi:hypothetical protein
VVVAAFSVALVSSPIAFPVVPDASPGVLVAFELAFQSLCSPSATTAASERQPLDLSQPGEGSVENSSLVAVG